MAELSSVDLDRHWGLGDARISVLGGGMNSATWLVRACGLRLVAKSVPASRRAGFAGGLRIAALVDRAGVATGAPVPTRTGELVADHGDRVLALLRWVPGVPLCDSAADQQILGRTLGRAHRAAQAAPIPPVQPFPWLDPDATHLDLEPWLRPAVTGALQGYRRLDPRTLTAGLLHSDPAPEAFRYRADTGVCGLIDWDAAIRGPLLYDVASAVMYVGGPRSADALLRAYTGTDALDAEEVHRALPTLLRIRWAVQADYFARRIATGDLTGIDGPDGNLKGLADARRALTGG